MLFYQFRVLWIRFSVSSAVHSNKILLSLRHCPKVALKICGILLVGDACQGRMFFHFEVFSVHNGIREFQQQKCIHGNMRLYSRGWGRRRKEGLLHSCIYSLVEVLRMTSFLRRGRKRRQKKEGKVFLK